MIIVLKKDITAQEISSIETRLFSGGFKYNIVKGVKYSVIPVIGDFTTSDIGRFRSMRGVDKVLRISSPYYLVTKEHKPKTVIDLGDGITVGNSFQTIAGPCSIENETSLDQIASYLSEKGVKILRGGTFKLRSSPYSFQGLGKEGLSIIQKIARKYDMKTISEIPSINHIDLFLEYVDIVQIGARSMNNFEMLKELGKSGKPVMLKRSSSAKIEDFLLSAEYILSEGNEQVILCERGVISFDESTRNSINIASVPILKEISHLPVILDPSHGVGIAKYVPPVAEAAVVLGADGVMIETHIDPENALSDGFQSITLEQMGALSERMKKLIKCKDEYS